MLIAIIGIISGLVVGFLINMFYTIDPLYSVYMYLLILALINSILTLSIKKNTEDFKIKYCFIYIFVDIIISIVVGIIGERLSLPLYLLVVFAFGNNIYKNINKLINLYITKKSV